MLAVIRARFREELDYELEASRLRGFAELHAGDPTVRVPTLVASRSAKRVLTTELARGVDLRRGLRGAGRSAPGVGARRCGASSSRARSWAAMLNADPHPGNYIFHPDGRVTFLDYGCVQTIEAEHRARAEKVHLAALRSRRGRLRAARWPRW